MLRERASFPMTCYSCSRKRHGRWLPGMQGACEPGRKECESICTPVCATRGGRAWPLIGKAVREMTVLVALLRAVNVGGPGNRTVGSNPTLFANSLCLRVIHSIGHVL